MMSEQEKLFIVHGIQDNLRIDGRCNTDYQTIEVETGIFPNCNGSSMVKLGGSKLLVGVKAELSAPKSSSPDRGWIEVSIDSLPHASLDIEVKTKDDLNSEISQLLTEICNINKLVDLKSLCIIPSQQVWVLYVDIMVSRCNGNLIDAASIATKAALFDTKIQSTSVKSDEDSEPEIEISDDPYDVFSLNVTNLPILFTLHRIGSQFVVDASETEDACSICKIVLGISNKDIVLIKKMGSGSFHVGNIQDALEIAQELGTLLQLQLMEKLNIEKDLPKRPSSLF